MIISDLSHLEVVSEAPSVAGGITSLYLSTSGTTDGSVFPIRSFFFKFNSTQVFNQPENPSSRQFIQGLDVTGLPSKRVGAFTYAADGGQASAWVALS